MPYRITADDIERAGYNKATGEPVDVSPARPENIHCPSGAGKTMMLYEMLCRLYEAGELPLLITSYHAPPRLRREVTQEAPRLQAEGQGEQQWQRK